MSLRSAHEKGAPLKRRPYNYTVKRKAGFRKPALQFCGSIEVGEDAFSGFAADDFAEAVDAGAAQICNAAKFAEEALLGFWANAGDFEKCGGGLALGAALAMKCDCEAMSFVANLLN